MKATAKVASAVAGVVVGLAATAAAFDVRWNWSRSLPMGLYRIDRLPAEVHVGELVVVCPPAEVAEMALERGYLARGSCPEGSQPLLKVVLGLDGDVVVADEGFVVGGELMPFTAPRQVDSEGRPLGQWRGGGGGVWVAGPNPWSWDSRYWGPVVPGRILARARPLSVERPAIIILGLIIGIVMGTTLRLTAGR
jgi:conjugative transfer signal peptidase TraF